MKHGLIAAILALAATTALASAGSNRFNAGDPDASQVLLGFAGEQDSSSIQLGFAGEEDNSTVQVGYAGEQDSTAIQLG